MIWLRFSFRCPVRWSTNEISPSPHPHQHPGYSEIRDQLDLVQKRVFLLTLGTLPNPLLPPHHRFRSSLGRVQSREGWMLFVRANWVIQKGVVFSHHQCLFIITKCSVPQTAAFQGWEPILFGPGKWFFEKIIMKMWPVLANFLASMNVQTGLSPSWISIRQSTRNL